MDRSVIFSQVLFVSITAIVAVGLLLSGLTASDPRYVNAIGPRDALIGGVLVAFPVTAVVASVRLVIRKYREWSRQWL